MFNTQTQLYMMFAAERRNINIPFNLDTVVIILLIPTSGIFTI